MGYAFISYSSKNQATAESMRQLLTKNRIRSWMAPHDIPIGSKYAQVINRAVKECDCFILLLTNDAQNSVWVAKEVERAINYRRPLIPIQLENLVLNDEFELYISSDQIIAIQTIDGETEDMKKILASVAAHAGKDLPPLTEVIKITPPTDEIKVKSIEPKKLIPKAKPYRPSPEAAKPVQVVQSCADTNSQYVFPPTDLLLYPNRRISYETGDYEKATAEEIINALASFNVKAKLVGIDKGPRITKYSISPDSGVSVSKIERLSDDIALRVGKDVRIGEPSAEKNSLGIEIANGEAELVTIREFIEAPEFKNDKSPTVFCVGKDISGKPIFSDIAKMPHILIAGSTGMGKSCCINSIITSILYKASPDQVRFIMIDPKRVEYSFYDKLPHLATPIITDPKKSVCALAWATREMDRRYELMISARVKSIDAYNEKVKETNGIALPKIVFFIDELGDLMAQERNYAEKNIMILAQKARAAGIHLVIGTQRPDVDVITGIIKANIPSRITCKVSTHIQSRNIIDLGGAEKLLKSGDMFFMPVGSYSPMRVQGCFVSERETEDIVNFISKQYPKANFIDEVYGEIEEIFKEYFPTALTNEELYDENYFIIKEAVEDKKFLSVVAMVIADKKASTAYIQRKAGIGYARASKYMDVMEIMGVISEGNGSKPREVLMSLDTWFAKLSLYTN